MAVIYLASPIDQVVPEAPHPDPIISLPGAEAWDRWGFYKQQAKNKLVELGHVCYDPAHAWATHRGGPEAIQTINEAARSTSDAMLAFLPDGIPTIGTPIEIAQMAATGKPVMVLGGPAAQRSPVLASLGVLVDDIFNWNNACTQLIETTGIATNNKSNALRLGSPYVSEVLAELVRAAAKFPENTPTNTPSDWFGIAVEEYLEVAQSYNDWKRDPRRHGAEAIRMELVQAGAMSARLYDSIRFID